MNGSNYLIPVDAVLERDIDVEDETVSLDRVTQVLERLSACGWSFLMLAVTILCALYEANDCSALHRTGIGQGRSYELRHAYRFCSKTWFDGV